MNRPALKLIIEGALLAHGRPLSIDRLAALFDERECPTKTEFDQALDELEQDLVGRGIELVQVATGYRIQVRNQCMPWVSRLWDEKPPRYSRALLETLSLIAYRQPISRGDIEDVRGVVVSTNIIKTLLEREWVRIVGYRDVPGRPALYATTPEFLDYFGLTNLEELPTLAEIREFDDANRQLELEDEPKVESIADELAEPASEEDVLESTADDLAEAEELMQKVEQNLFGDKDSDDQEIPPKGQASQATGKISVQGTETDGNRRKGFAELVKRMQQKEDPEA